MVKIINELSKTSSVSVTTDHWSDEHRHRNFLGLNVQYILGTKIVNRVLAVKEVNGKTCEETAVVCKQILQQFGKNS